MTQRKGNSVSSTSLHYSMLIFLPLVPHRSKATLLHRAQAKVLEQITNLLSRTFGKYSNIIISDSSTRVVAVTLSLVNYHPICLLRKAHIWAGLVSPLLHCSAHRGISVCRFLRPVTHQAGMFHDSTHSVLCPYMYCMITLSSATQHIQSWPYCYC